MKNTKKVVSLVLMLLMTMTVFSTFKLPVKAVSLKETEAPVYEKTETLQAVSSDVVISSTVTAVPVGETLTVSVDLSTIAEIGAIAVDVLYNNSALELIPREKDSRYFKGIQGFDPDEGAYGYTPFFGHVPNGDRDHAEPYVRFTIAETSANPVGRFGGAGSRLPNPAKSVMSVDFLVLKPLNEGDIGLAIGDIAGANPQNPITASAELTFVACTDITVLNSIIEEAELKMSAYPITEYTYNNAIAEKTAEAKKLAAKENVTASEISAMVSELRTLIDTFNPVKKNTSGDVLLSTEILALPIGEELTVSVDLSTKAEIGAMAFDLVYDKTVLELIPEASERKYFHGLTVFDSVNQEVFGYGACIATHIPDGDKDHNQSYMRFTIAETAVDPLSRFGGAGSKLGNEAKGFVTVRFKVIGELTAASVKLFGADISGATPKTPISFAEPKVDLIFHVHTPQIIPGYGATFDEPGLSDGEICSVCGEVIKEQQVIERLHENVSFTYTATGINNSAYAVNTGFIRLDIKMNVNTDLARLWGFQFSLNFDNTVLELVNAEAANTQLFEYFLATPFDKANNDGTVILVQNNGINPDDLFFEKGSYDVISLLFTVKTDYTASSVTFTVDSEQPREVNRTEPNVLDVDFGSGVSIEIKRLGDSDGDGFITNEDSLNLSKWYAEALEGDYSAVFDLNKDSVIDAEDFALLRGATVGDDSYLYIGFN